MSCGVYTIGQFKDFAGAPASAPSGYLYADGSCQLQATYPDLYAVIGTNYGTCSAGSFALPDARSNVMVALAQQGNNGTATPLNTCGTQTTLGGYCGSQQEFISRANLPSVNFNVNIPAGQGAHSHTFTGEYLNLGTTAGAENYMVATGTFTTSTATLPAMTGTAASGGSGAGLQTIPPMQFITKIIKF